MSKAAKLIAALAVTLLIVGGAYLLFSGDQDSSDTPSRESQGQSQGSTDKTPSLTITYTDKGFQPAAATVKAGEAVRITNNSQADLEFASDPHPAHTENEELNAGDIMPGQSAVFEVSKKGSWGFHNHYNADDTGTLTVE